MKNIHQSNIDKKNELIADLSAKKSNLQDEEFDLFQYLLEKGSVIYLPGTVDIERLTKNIKSYMQSDLNLKTETSVLDNNIFI